MQRRGEWRAEHGQTALVGALFPYSCMVTLVDPESGAETCVYTEPLTIEIKETGVLDFAHKHELERLDLAPKASSGLARKGAAGGVAALGE